MAKRLTVFYSWQSDSPSNLNRSFIEKALHAALERLPSNPALENALRDTTVELDKDTQGIAGSPPIAETILQKIEDCAVFVADLSFVGVSKNGFTNASGKPRQFPNPNVLIEYGYALRCHSHAKLVGIMNTAYGKPDAESLPFDLRHLRWPITYQLTDSSATDKNDQFFKLVETLVKAIGLILENHTPPNPVVESFIPQPSITSPAIFYSEVADLSGDRSDIISVPDGAKAYLRLYPVAAVPRIKTQLNAKYIATKGNLYPMGRIDGWGFDRNILGAIVYGSPPEGKLLNFTQLFLTREIWGIDAMCLNPDFIKHNSVAYIANGLVEQVFVAALQNYLMFSQAVLNLPLPLRIEAGLVGIKNYPISVNNYGISGKSLNNDVKWQGEINEYGIPSWKILSPFFESIWDNCGFQRPPQSQIDLAKHFGG